MFSRVYRWHQVTHKRIMTWEVQPNYDYNPHCSNRCLVLRFEGTKGLLDDRGNNWEHDVERRGLPQNCHPGCSIRMLSLRGRRIPSRAGCQPPWPFASTAWFVHELHNSPRFTLIQEDRIPFSQCSSMETTSTLFKRIIIKAVRSISKCKANSLSACCQPFWF